MLRSDSASASGSAGWSRRTGDRGTAGKAAAPGAAGRRVWGGGAVAGARGDGGGAVGECEHGTWRRDVVKDELVARFQVCGDEHVGEHVECLRFRALAERGAHIIDRGFRVREHLDCPADGSYRIMRAETAGEVVKVDVAKMEITGALSVGGSPLDVRLDPGGKLFYIANQGTGGVDVVDGDSMKLVEFIKTDKGAHGIGMSRDATRMFVTNRIAGSI